MMAHKHLSELLCEDQEPFVLQNYIDDRRCQLKRSVPKTHLQIKRRKPISENSTFRGSFCKNACFFSFHESPDVTKSPLFNFPSPVKSPCTNSDTLFVHIPSRTAALLLEAALRIQKQSSSSKQKNQKSQGFGFFGSFLKKITLGKRNRNREIKRDDDDTKVSVRNILRWDSSVGCQGYTEEKQRNPETVMGFDEQKRVSEISFSCSCNSRRSSVWSESNEEDKSVDLDTSSSRSEDSEELEFTSEERATEDFCSCEKGFCSSPFRFALQNSPVSGHRTPEFSSPATSPIRRQKEVSGNEEGSLDCVGKQYKEEEEEEKEQCSPVSVLDPPFEDDEEEEEEHENKEEEEEEDYELDRSFAIVQRTKLQLLQKLRRFERLAELDPVELEKRIAGEDDDDDEECEDDYARWAENEFVKEVFSGASLCHQHRRISSDMKTLVLDLIAEEEGGACDESDREVVVEKVRKRLESWNEVESNTIDMMVEWDLRRECDLWRRNHEEFKEMGMEIELAILGLLVEEISDELVSV